MTKAKKPTTTKEWEKICDNLNSALQLCLQQENLLIAEIEQLRTKNDEMHTDLAKAAGIIQYLETKLERSNSI